MNQSPTPADIAEKFIQRWHGVTASELATAKDKHPGIRYWQGRRSTSEFKIEFDVFHP